MKKINIELYAQYDEGEDEMQAHFMSNIKGNNYLFYYNSDFNNLKDLLTSLSKSKSYFVEFEPCIVLKASLKDFLDFEKDATFQWVKPNNKISKVAALFNKKIVQYCKRRLKYEKI